MPHSNSLPIVKREVSRSLTRKKSRFWFRQSCPRCSSFEEIKAHIDPLIAPRMESGSCSEDNEYEDEDDDWYTMQECPLSDNLVCPIVASISKQDEEETIARITHKANKMYNLTKISDAESLFRLGKDIAERTYGSDHAEVVKGFCNIAKCCLRQGHFREARSKYLKAIDQSQQLVNAGHWEGVELLLNAHVGLALVYINQSKLNDAENQSNIAKSLVELHFDEYSIESVEVVEVQAALADRRGRYDEAVSLYTKTLRILEKNKGFIHQRMARILKALSTILRKQRNFYLAERYLKVAIEKLAQCKCSNGLDHADLLVALGDLNDEQHRYDRAEALYSRSMTIRENTLGGEHPDVGYICNAMGINRINMGIYDAETENYFLRGIQIFSHIPGHKQDANLAVCTGNLGLLYLKRADPMSAIVYLQRARVMEEAIFGPDHPDVGNTLFHIAEAFIDAHKYPHDHTNTFEISAEAEADLTEADAFLSRAHAIYLTSFGASHQLTASTAHKLDQLRTARSHAHSSSHASHHPGSVPSPSEPCEVRPIGSSTEPSPQATRDCWRCPCPWPSPFLLINKATFTSSQTLSNTKVREQSAESTSCHTRCDEQLWTKQCSDRGNSVETSKCSSTESI